jgi:hypothetical protein
VGAQVQRVSWPSRSISTVAPRSEAGALPLKRSWLLRNVDAMVVMLMPLPEAVTVTFPGWVRALGAGWELDCGAGWLAPALGPTEPPPEEARAGVASTAAHSASELATNAVAR